MNDSFFTRRRLMLFISVLSLIFGIWWFFFRKFETYIFTITTYPSATATVPAVVSKINVEGGTVLQTIDLPDVNIGIIISSFPKPGFGAAAAVAAAFPKEVVFEKDANFRPIDGPVNSTASATNYALDQIAGTGGTVTTPSESCSAAVRIIAIDSGISQDTAEFPTNRVTFGTPWVPTEPPPIIPIFTPPAPNAWLDETDHGTKVLSTSIGATAGVLSRVSNVNTIVQSFKVHRPTATTAFTSDIVSGMSKAVQEEFLRHMDGNLRNDGTILTFPYRNFCGLSPALDTVMSSAWNNGIIVVAGAGNDNMATEPPLVTSADLLKPPAPCSGTAIFPSSPSRTVGNNFLIFAAGSTATNLRWIGGNYSPQTDIFAPGESVNVMNAAGTLVSANGTSMSTGYVAGALTWLVAQRPWITPAEARDWMMNPSVSAQQTRIATGSGSTQHRLDLRKYNLPDTSKMSYTRWRLAHNLPIAVSPKDDFDYDSQVDLVEFALGTNPRGRGDKGLRIENGKVICPLAFYLTCNANNVSVVLQGSPDLVNWTDITNKLVTAPGMIYENDGIVRQMNMSDLPGSPNGKGFCRLHVIVVP